MKKFFTKIDPQTGEIVYNWYTIVGSIIVVTIVIGIGIYFWNSSVPPSNLGPEDGHSVLHLSSGTETLLITMHMLPLQTNIQVSPIVQVNPIVQNAVEIWTQEGIPQQIQLTPQQFIEKVILIYEDDPDFFQNELINQPLSVVILYVNEFII